MSSENHLKNTDIHEVHRQLVVVYNWFYISMYILNDVVCTYVLKADGAGRVLFVLTVLALILNLQTVIKVFFTKQRPACLLWLALTAFSFVNSLIMGFTSKYGTFVFIRNNFTDPLVFLMVSTCMLRKHETKTLVVMLSAMLLYIVFGVANFNIPSGSLADISSSHLDRVLNENLGNLLPLFAVPTVLVASFLRQENKLRWLYLPIVMLAIFPILMSATRKAFAAVAVVLLAFVIGKRKIRKTSSIVAMAIMLFALSAGLFFVMDNTLVGERFAKSFKEQEVFYPLVSDPAINKVLNGLLGDRAGQYYYGFRLFFEHPLNGIGLMNFMKKTGSEYRIHSEYMVQLCENGIIGFGLLVAFIAVVMYRLINMPVKRSTHKLVFGGFLAVLVIGFTAWTYCSGFVMVIYAVVLSTIYPIEKKIEVIEDEQNDNSDSER